ncbi:MAG: HEAT repeat domain-containing protein [Lentisphaerae bacterium]|nr:HEAT repeat domain-containing protein [Lentisphaerota bacterium]MBT4815637.1 HEAT repeat domain-containing protein [Lentisphaerota bacterium]MBT5604870.1 HEAT repeat domain-containing protein [Lentisphaerota bacterium]MBT7054211.1 HEAT repeat domain-containing protein [Lentisphaerota bacterium]MBT7841008.1 HEAT repeat domain-containing protein [Lentisphaerota bacterium]
MNWFRPQVCVAAAATLALTGVCLQARAEWRPRPAQEGETVGVYVSNGDNELLYTSPPVDSKAAIDDLVELIDRVYKAKILFWRGAQIDQMLNHSVRRPESRAHGEWIEWMDHLFHDVGTIDYAVEAAHKRGMKVWGVAALLDHGGAAHVGTGKGYGPMIIESKLRVEHPEWIPIDRFGIRRMAGPICLATPEARHALVEMFTGIAERAGYDGLLFHTYAEEFHARFDDEFGFNPAVVADYKELTGINVFANDTTYDRDAMAHLRGRYLSALVRELGQALHAKGIKLGLMLDSVTPWYPQKWGLQDTRVTGRLIVDWQQYAREGWVDLLWVNYNGPQHETVNNVIAGTKGLPVQLMMMHSDQYPAAYQHFRTCNVDRLIPSGYDHMQWGYLERQPAEALTDGDLAARLAVLRQMKDGETPFDVAAVCRATRDLRVYVRRMALEVLGVHGADNADALAAAEAALSDPENPVRTYAVRALVKIGTTESIDKIYSMLATKGNYMLKNIAVPWCLQTLPVDRSNDIVRGLEHPEEIVRTAAVTACRAGPLRPTTLPALVELASDQSIGVRWRTTEVLARYPNSPEARNALFGLLTDSSGAVRNMAALKLSGFLQTSTRWVGPEALQLYRELSKQFRKYGESSQLNDADWGWRCVGEALARMGTRGQGVLRECLAQTEDSQLAERAWDVLHVELSAYKFLKTDPAEAMKGYRAHPRFRKAAPPVPKAPVEPIMMPYIYQGFDGEAFRKQQGTLAGNLRHESGGWITLSKTFPEIATVERKDDDGKAAGRYARAIRGRCMVEGRRSDYRISKGRIRAEIDVLREDADSAASICLLPEANRWKDSTICVGFRADGMLEYREANRRMHAVEASLPQGKWGRLFIEADLDAGTYRFDADLGEGRRKLVEKIPFTRKEKINLILVYPNGRNGTITGIDRIRVFVDNPGHPEASKGDQERDQEPDQE